MAQLFRGGYEPLSGVLYNATTSVLNLGTTPQAVTAQTCLALIYPLGSGENGFGWVWSRADSGNNGQRLVIDHNGGSPRLQCVGSCTGSSGNPTGLTPSNSVVYNKWNHVGFFWNGDATGANSIGGFTSQSGAPLIGHSISLTLGSGSATNSAANNLLIGNSFNSDRTFNGTIAYVARWNRVIRQSELIVAQKFGPLAVPEGLIMCWANNRDYGQYNLRPTSKTALTVGRAPPSRGLLVPGRVFWTPGSAITADSKRWFLAI